MPRPWELGEPNRPWELARAVYNRTISVYRRPHASDSAASSGPLAYQEPQASANVLVWNTTPIYTGIACSIQEETKGKGSATDLPGSDIVPYWRIFIPYSGLAKGSLQIHDNVMDEIGTKYRLTSTYWDAMGYRAFAILLEA
jgi:hypothetical protein